MRDDRPDARHLLWIALKRRGCVEITQSRMPDLPVAMVVANCPRIGEPRGNNVFPVRDPCLLPFDGKDPRMNLVQVIMELEHDDDGYPPYDTERVWAREAPGGGYIIDNIPFFANKATYGDIVDVEYRDGEA